MMKIGAFALFGFLVLSPVAQAADTPAFVNATVCDAAAPITAATAVIRRHVSAQVGAHKRVAQRPVARPQQRAAAPAQARRHAARPAPRPVEETEVPSNESEAVLRPAVHFCITPAGWDNPVRYT
ncbi:hypothetical protein [Muricoccus aerilatus]|uniref:hypothetical protein n=1 Tax=Muricoccus aerilatus TaxID=452982 RepID=UPI0005C1E4C7|nr:hypothetical protein [Roseomonas aerilata]